MSILVQKYKDEEQALFIAIKDFQQGNKNKATYIYENTKKYTYRLIYQQVSRLKNQGVLSGDENAITEDVMQELYLDFFKNIKTFRNEDQKSFYKWISIVANRMVLKYTDRNKMEILQYEKNDEFREEQDIWDSSEMDDSDLNIDRTMIPEAALEDKEFQKLIMDFIQSLPDVQAQTVLYHFYSGMKYQEIADEMGVSLITVKTRMKKAQDALRKIVTQYEEKSGIKLHGVAILPSIWIVYHLCAEQVAVPSAIGASVTGVAAGQAKTMVAKATMAAGKKIGMKIVIGISSASVIIGSAIGAAVISWPHIKPLLLEEEKDDDDESEKKKPTWIQGETEKWDEPLEVNLEAVTWLESTNDNIPFLHKVIQKAGYAMPNMFDTCSVNMGDTDLELLTEQLTAAYLIEQNLLGKELYKTVDENGNESTSIHISESELRDFCIHSLGMEASYQSYISNLKKTETGEYIVSDKNAKIAYNDIAVKESTVQYTAVQISEERVVFLGSYQLEEYDWEQEKWVDEDIHGTVTVIARKNPKSHLNGYTYERVVYEYQYWGWWEIGNGESYKQYNTGKYSEKTVDGIELWELISEVMRDNKLYDEFKPADDHTIFLHSPLSPFAVLLLSDTEGLLVGNQMVAQAITNGSVSRYDTDKYNVISKTDFVIKFKIYKDESGTKPEKLEILYKRE